MKISMPDLQTQLFRVENDWPFLHTIAAKYGLPYCLLHAVGSRETNLRNIIGDNGHGHGVFQLDDRSHTIPPNFMNDITMQAETAAKMLHDNFNRIGNWTSACNMYNSGKPAAQSTTGGDYGPDVMERRANMAALIPIQTSPQPHPEFYAQYGQRSDLIQHLQIWFNNNFPLYSHITPTNGNYGDQTTAVVKEFARRCSITDADGRNVGPKISAKLYELGFRG